MTKIVALEKACELVTDGTHYTPKDIGAGVPFLTVKDVNDRTIDLAGCSFISEADFLAAKASNSAPRRGDVLFSKDGTVGKVHVVATDQSFAVLSSLAILRPKSDTTDAGYLGHALRAPAALDQALKKKTGSAIRRIVLSDLRQVQIPLPPLPEQRRIAAILDQANALRARRREALEELDELEESHFEAFHGDTAATHVDCSLVDLAEKQRGSFVNGPFGSDLLTSELQETGVPVVYIRDIRNGDYQRVSDVCVSERKARDLAVCEVRPGDVLVAKVGDPPGTAAVYPSGEPTAVVTQDVIRIRPNLSVVRPEFLRAYLNSSVGRWQIAAITVEATRARISLGDFKKLTIKVPPVGEQGNFVARVQTINSQRRRMAASLADLDSLFASLQHRAFAGQL